jgi:hypothetical protein
MECWNSLGSPLRLGPPKKNKKIDGSDIMVIYGNIW